MSPEFPGISRARLVERAEDWPWSSTRAHLAGEDDHVVRVAPALERVGDFAAFLGEPFDEALSYAALRHMMRDSGNDDAGEPGHARRDSTARMPTLFSIVSPELFVQVEAQHAPLG